jgi:thioredoxin-like negative regulator of GroEL
MTVEELIGDNKDTPSGASAAYGLANWYYYTGQKEMATEHLEALVASNSWAAFGFIAAEADLASR